MTLESALTFFIAIFIFGITPGPGIFAILARALTQGARSCITLAFGMTLSDAVYLVLASFSLSAIAANYAEVFTVIRVLGALYLLYLAWKMWTAPIADPQTATGVRAAGHWRSLFQGIAISASNPKVILFYIAFLPTFMDLSRLTGSDILLAVVLTLTALMTGLMLIALAASRVRFWIRSAAGMRRLNRSAASIMGGAGVWLLTKH
ncbi:MAG: LysE family translocator [Saccharospirillum sp.]